MTKKNTFLVSIGLVFLSLVINPYVLGFCIENEKYCIFRSYSHTIGEPLFIISLSLMVCSLILFFMKDEVFKFWLKFAYIWIPLTSIFVIISPEYDSGLIPIEKESVSILFSVLFLLISIIIIISKSISLRKK